MGRVLALDPGSRRIGVAVSDPLRIAAHPVEVVDADGSLDRIAELVERYEPDVVVVGLPVGLDGREGPAAARARTFGSDVAARTGREVVYVDERFTTATAERVMIEAGTRRRARRERIDTVAATIILEQYLGRER